MNAQQVSESMQFANKHNIRIVIKNTGHDFLGRSETPYVLTSSF
jgi:hypothetical protein